MRDMAQARREIVDRFPGRDRAPYDGILVTAMAPDELPGALLEQLALDGTLVYPVGHDSLGSLVRYREGRSENLESVGFVPLVSDAPRQRVRGTAGMMQEFPARGGDDDRVHIADAPEDALLDPSPYSTRCGQAVLEVGQ